MKKHQPLAYILGTIMASAATTPALAGKEVNCKVGKQTYVFSAVPGKKVTTENIKKLAKKEGSSYTEVEWTYLKKVAPQIARKDAIKCGTTAFLKIDTFLKIKGDGIKVNSSIFLKGDDW